MSKMPRTPLDAEERALAAALPRLHGRTEPDAGLDARILAAAHATPTARLRTPRRQRSWVVPISVAASLTLAVGLAWQLRPLPSLQQPAAQDAATESVAAVSMIEPPPAVAKPGAVAESASAAAQPAAPQADTQAVAASPRTAPAPAPVPASPPPPPPAPPVAAPAMPAPAPAAEMAGTASAPANAPVQAAATKAQSATMAKSAAAPAAAAGTAARNQVTARQSQNEAEMAADAASADMMVLADDDIPPATADSPKVRQAWLDRIGELLEQGHVEEAKESLAEFKRRHPQAELPPELRALEP